MKVGNKVQVLAKTNANINKIGIVTNVYAHTVDVKFEIGGDFYYFNEVKIHFDPQDFINKVKEQYAMIDDQEHMILESGLQLKNEIWESIGKPYTWILVKSTDDIQLYIDCAYGTMALFNGIDVVTTKQHTLVWDKYVAIWKDYYNSDYELFKAVE